MQLSHDLSVYVKPNRDVALSMDGKRFLLSRGSALVAIGRISRWVPSRSNLADKSDC